MCPDNTCVLVEVAEEAVEVSGREEKKCTTPEKKLLGNRRPSRKFERLYRIGEVSFSSQSGFYYGSPPNDCTVVNSPVDCSAWSKYDLIAGARKGWFWDGVRWSKAEGRAECGDQAHCQEQSHRDGAGETFISFSCEMA